MLDLGQVRSFVMLATELNFSRAARRLNITQPPFSRQIRLLEQTLEVQLVQRTSRSVALTPAGHAFLNEARALLAQSDVAATRARQAARASGGLVRLAFVGAATYDFLPRLIAHVRAVAPHIELELVQLESAEQLEAINAERVDIGLARPRLEQHHLSTMQVASEAMMLAIPQGHSVAERRRPALQAIHGEAFVMYAPAARYLHEKLTMLLQAQGIQPRIVQYMMQSQAVLSLVGAGVGLAIVPQETRNATFNSIVFAPLDPALNCVAELEASWLPDNGNPVLPELRRLLAGLR